MPKIYPKQRPLKPERLARQAARMREHYLNTGIGCKTRAKVIERRTS